MGGESTSAKTSVKVPPRSMENRSDRGWTPICEYYYSRRALVPGPLHAMSAMVRMK